MKRRLCQYCEEPLSRWSYLLLRRTCADCAYRRAHGGGPMTPEGRRRIQERAQREPSARLTDEVWAAKQALAHPSRYHGDGGTWHHTTDLTVETDTAGRVVAVWFRCQMLPFRQRTVDDARAAGMEEAGPVPVKITGVEVLDLE